MRFGLFFDLDGTLIDSERAHWRAWQLTLRSRGLNLSWHEYEREGVGLTDPTFLNRFSEINAFRFTKEQQAAILDEKTRWLMCAIDARPLIHPEIAALVHEFADIPKALVTSSRRAETFAILQAGGLQKCFQAVICMEDVSRFKPDPEPYLAAMTAVGATRGLAFEDSAAGRASAAAATLEVVEIRAPSELPKIVRKILFQKGL